MMPDAPLEMNPLLIVLFLTVLTVLLVRLSRLLIDESKKHVGLRRVIQRVSGPDAVGLQHSISL
jgi:hypothetical protein